VRKIAIFLLFFVTACKGARTSKSAKDKAKELLEKIALGDAIGEFPSKYFPKEQSAAILQELRDKCDFKNRREIMSMISILKILMEQKQYRLFTSFILNAMA
jgi:hypothetical protein